jgi:hypothetical protein
MTLSNHASLLDYEMENETVATVKATSAILKINVPSVTN